ncbi:SPOR domain-containing protein [Magnetovirga frankeli]|uniref:AAA family ATPase n=1 Tax=Magnetovirga frankeli TaxID=947516 RepID=UPI0012939483|nr:SPOR domain-containing protein [gamma proteobacterium SS-5]
MDFNTTHKLKQLLLLLQQHPANSQRIPLVLGPTASGKSALMRQLCRKTPSQWRLSQVQGSPDINGLGLIRQLALDWMPERSVGKKSELMQGLIELKQRGLLPVVAVDDADRLPQEALRLLLQLRREAGAAGFHPILFAASDQLTELQRMAAGDPLQLLYLSPWTAEEVAALYKQERGKNPSLGQLNRLLERSAGWPGRLLELLDDPSALHPSWFNLSLGLILGLLVIVGLFFARLPETQDLLGRLNLTSDSTPSPLGEGLTPGLPEGPGLPVTDNPAERAAASGHKPLSERQGAGQQPAPVLPPRPRPQPTPEPEPAPELRPRPPLPQGSPRPERGPPEQPQPPVRPAARAPQAQAPNKGLLQDNAWLKRQPAGLYSLQLGHFTRLADLRAFAARHQLDKDQPLAVIKQGQGYLLIYGLYPDQRAAARARLLVPEGLQPERITVWPVQRLQEEAK